MNQYTSRKLISIIVASMGFSDNDIDVTFDDIADISLIAKKQRILPLVVVGLKNNGYSDLLTDELIKGEAKSIFDYTQHQESLKEISEAFEHDSIDYIPLKGAIIRDLYPEPWMRTSSDIDVLIHKEDLDKAINVLELNTSFKFLRRDLHDVHFVNKYVHLELHFSLDYSVEKISNALSDPWANSIKYQYSNQYLFSTEYNMFYIVSHAAKHFIQNGGVGIRPLLDIYVLKTHTFFDETIVRSFCDNAGVLGFYEICCNLINVWFNGEPYDEITQIFEEVVLSGGVFGSKHLKIISNKRRDSGKKYISGRIFKTREELANYYPKCRKYPVLVPYYQVVRWTKVLKVNKTKEYLSEFNEANSIAQTDVDKYNKLLKAMRLQ